jgi:ribosomal protein L31
VRATTVAGLEMTWVTSSTVTSAVPNVGASSDVHPAISAAVTVADTTARRADGRERRA